MKEIIRITVNGEPHELLVDARTTLLEALREHIGLTGAKEGCGLGECGSCTVIVDQKPTLSCLVLAVDVAGKEVLTIEGLARGTELHPIQQAFVDHGAIQCGYCTPGMVMTAKALLDENPHPTQEDTKKAISGNLCRCTGYTKILEAIGSVHSVGDIPKEKRKMP